ncbi:MAG: amidohydrolase [Candidatus Bathyarchaeia archaeon]|nr:amidohydrolase [Candidatus Bathyarchaeota archaeon]
MSSLKAIAIDWIRENEERIIELCDKIWEYAELGLMEYKSSKILSDELEKHGFKVDRGVAGMPTAFIASYGEGKPIIGIIGEYDALPGLSQKKVPYREPLEPGKPGHGCGHNIYGASGAAASIAIRYAMDKGKIQGTIRFYGCPAEENFGGKVFMVREGLFNDVDAVIGHHPGSTNGVSLASTLAFNSVRFHFYGKSSHAGGSPERGRSALDAVELMNIGVNYLREHIIQDARIHYIVERGGDQPNIVPAYARSWYYIRAPERDQLDEIYEWVLDIAKGAAMMTRTSLEVEFIQGCYNLIQNRTIAEIIIQNMREIGTPKYDQEELKFAEEISKTIFSSRDEKIAMLKASKRPDWDKLVDKLIDDGVPDPSGEGGISHGSTDLADVSWQTPTVEFSTAAWVLGTPGHSWQAAAQSGVGLGHKSAIFGAKVIASTVLDLLTRKDLLAKAKDEHRARIGDRKYKSPLPADHKPPIRFWEER